MATVREFGFICVFVCINFNTFGIRASGNYAP